MDDDAPRRALSEVERETLSSPEEISRAQQRTLPPAVDAPSRFLHEMERHRGDSTNDQMAAALGIMLGEISRLERKVVKLESRPVQMGYRGVWKSGERYRRDELVTHGGNLWACKQDTECGPHNSDHFQLAVKRGRA